MATAIVTKFQAVLSPGCEISALNDLIAANSPSARRERRTLAEEGELDRSGARFSLGEAIYRLQISNAFDLRITRDYDPRAMQFHPPTLAPHERLGHPLKRARDVQTIARSLRASAREMVGAGLLRDERAAVDLLADALLPRFLGVSTHDEFDAWLAEPTVAAEQHFAWDGTAFDAAWDTTVAFSRDRATYNVMLASEGTPRVAPHESFGEFARRHLQFEADAALRGSRALLRPRTLSAAASALEGARSRCLRARNRHSSSSTVAAPSCRRGVIESGR